MSDCHCCTDARAARWTPATLKTENALLERDNTLMRGTTNALAREVNRMERERDEALAALERSEQRARSYRALLRGIIHD